MTLKTNSIDPMQVESTERTSLTRQSQNSVSPSESSEMGNPDDKKKHSRRRRNLQKERVRSNIAKDLLTPKYSQRIVQDKRGREHDLHKLSNLDLIKLINEED